MALIHCDFYSEVLDLCTSCMLFSPNYTADIQERGKSNHKYPTLYLLHGLSDDHTIWQRRTSIERYVEPLAGGGHAGCASELLHRHGRWVSLLDFYQQRVAGTRALVFSAVRCSRGQLCRRLSMAVWRFQVGAYHPDRYAAAASLSGRSTWSELPKRRMRLGRRKSSASLQSPEHCGERQRSLLLAEQVAGTRAPGCLFTSGVAQKIPLSGECSVPQACQALGWI